MLLVCGADGVARVHEPKSGKSWRFDLPDGFEVDLVLADRIVLTDPQARSLIVDRAGNPLVTGIEGRIRDADDRLVVIATEQPAAFGVYRLAV